MNKLTLNLDSLSVKSFSTITDPTTTTTGPDRPAGTCVCFAPPCVCSAGPDCTTASA